MFYPPYKSVKPKGVYVYTHSRATDRTLFYVGVGRQRRAWNKSSGRNAHWKNIARKHGVEVSIIKDDMCESEAFDLERRLITHHAPVANYTTGGEGRPGIPSSDRQKAAAVKARSKPVINSNGEVFPSATIAAKVLNDRGIAIRRATISGACVSGKNAHGMSWAFYTDGSVAPPHESYVEKTRKLYGQPVMCSNGMSFESYTAAADWLRKNGFPKASGFPISRCARGVAQSSYGYSWSLTK